jgi:hypothetical protein
VSAHVAQAGTLTSREEVERKGWSTLHRRALSRQERGWREEVAIHVAQMGTLPLKEEKGEKDVRRCRSTLHRWSRSRRRVWGKRGMRVVREDTLPRCIEEYRLLTRRAGRGG